VFAIGNINGGMVDASFLKGMVAMLKDESEIKFIMHHAPCGMLHLARNLVVREFLQSDEQHLLFIDSDMVWGPDTAWEMWKTALREDFPVLSAHVFSPAGDDPKNCMPIACDVNFAPLHGEGLVRAFCVGMAFCLIRRDVFEEMSNVFSEPSPWFDYGTYNGRVASEDVTFAARCKELDIPIFVDTNARVGHRKVHTFETPVPRVFA
jgi:hypothetical protein